MQVESVVSSDLRARPEAVVALQVLGAGELIPFLVCVGEYYYPHLLGILAVAHHPSGRRVPLGGRRVQVACSLS